MSVAAIMAQTSVVAWLLHKLKISCMLCLSTLTPPACCAASHTHYQPAALYAADLLTAAQPCASALLTHQHVVPVRTHATSMLCSQPYTLPASSAYTYLSSQLMHKCSARPPACCARQHSPNKHYHNSAPQKKKQLTK